MTSPEPTPEQWAEKWLREHDGSTRQPPVPSRIALLAALIRDVREDGRKQGVEQAAKACDNIATAYSGARKDIGIGKGWAAKLCAERCRALAGAGGGESAEEGRRGEA